ncbi:hypothetical protein IFR05_011014 [Cadophora sp. M221]|nr:hypothetical protein IFR05_011014 [Cadophora sp. M221]
MDTSTRNASVGAPRLHGGSSRSDGEESKLELVQTQILRNFQYEDLPNATSIRLLDIVESSQDAIRCRLRVVDLEEDIEYSTLSYTWGNPITIYEEPMPDLDQYSYPEEVDKFPFTYSTPPLGPSGERLVGVDGAKRDYLSIYPYIPHERVDWKRGSPRTIEIDGYEVTVEENLFLCLLALGSWRSRHTTKSISDGIYNALGLPIWIDALSIDQSNLVERASQVQLMGRIYKSASVVLSWIGQSDKLSSIAFDATKMILDYDATRTDAIFAPETDDTVDRPEPMDTLLSSIPGMNQVHWFSIFSLLQRLYFRRAWIAQEVIFSESTLVICAEGILSMELLLTVFSFIVENGLDHELCRLGRNMLTNEPLSNSGHHLLKLASFRDIGQISGVGSLVDRISPQEHQGHSQEQRSLESPKRLEIDPKNAFSFILGYHHVRGRLGLSNAGMPMIRHLTSSNDPEGVTSWDVDIPESLKLDDHTIEHVEGGGIIFHRRPLRLLSVLSEFRNLDATDPRDKIFAFLNLATDDLGIVPNYHANVQDVFRNATADMILSTRSLSALSQIQDVSETKIRDLPGWVPDFSARPERIPFDRGGEDCQFCALPEYHDNRVILHDDGTLGVNGWRVDKVGSTTDVGGDAVVQVLKLALNAPWTYPGEPLSWWSITSSTGRHRELQSCAVGRVEALWRTLVADQLTEVDEDYGSIDSRAGLSSGFISWIIADILEARRLLVEYIDIDPETWASRLIYASFCTRLALWSAIYDGKQMSTFPSVGDLEAALADLRAKREDEETNLHELQESEECPLESLKAELEHFPTAQQISECLSSTVEEPNEEDHDSLLGVYKLSALLRLTPLQRRQLRMFEKKMRRATDGRRLFCTEEGRFGLGPKSVGQNEGFTDEIWILKGAKVPFILRREEGDKYRIVGEAYVHGIMYGEKLRDDNWEEIGYAHEIRLL